MAGYQNMCPVGFEPTTSELEIQRSTTKNQPTLPAELGAPELALRF